MMSAKLDFSFLIIAELAWIYKNANNLQVMQKQTWQQGFLSCSHLAGNKRSGTSARALNF